MIFYIAIIIALVAFAGWALFFRKTQPANIAALPAAQKELLRTHVDFYIKLVSS